MLHQPVRYSAGATLDLSDVKLRLAGGPEPASLRVNGTLTATNVTFSGGHGPRAERAGDRGERRRLAAAHVERRRRPRVEHRPPGHHRPGPGLRRHDRRHHPAAERPGIERGRRGPCAPPSRPMSAAISTAASAIHDSCESAVIRRHRRLAEHRRRLRVRHHLHDVSVIGGSTEPQRRKRSRCLQARPHVDIEGLAAWGNGSGITSQDGAVVAVSGAKLSANQLDGITMNAESGSLSVVQSRIDHNVRAGISVSSGTTTVGPGNLINCQRHRGAPREWRVVGERRREHGRAQRARRLQPVERHGITIRDNRIVNNGDAAFSVARSRATPSASSGSTR